MAAKNVCVKLSYHGGHGGHGGPNLFKTGFSSVSSVSSVVERSILQRALSESCGCGLRERTALAR